MDKKQEAKNQSVNKKVKLREIVEGINALKELSNQKLPVFESFKISLFLKNIAPTLEAYEAERNKLVQELGTPVKEKGKETGNFNFEDEKAKEFNEKIASVLDVDVDVDVPVISIKALGDIKIEPINLSSLMWLLVE